MGTVKDSIQPDAGFSAAHPDMAAMPSNGPGPVTDTSGRREKDAPPSSGPAASVIGRRSKGQRSARQRPERVPGCVEALKMLTLRPVFATSVPRHHVDARTADGSRLVLDRATNQQFVVYLPRFVNEFRAGHRAGQWYLRCTTDHGAAPAERSFPSAHAAVAALRNGDWAIAEPRRERARKNCRIIWS